MEKIKLINLTTQNQSHNEIALWCGKKDLVRQSFGMEIEDILARFLSKYMTVN